MKKEKLYDMRLRDYPNKRGDSFRSLQVYKCWVCHAMTNRVVMGGYPGYGVRTICPNSAEDWHHTLENKLEWSRHPHPAEYQLALEKEIEEHRSKHVHLLKNDIVGEPILEPAGEVTNTMSWKLRESEKNQ